MHLFRHGPQHQRVNKVCVTALENLVVATLISKQKIAGHHIAKAFADNCFRQGLNVCKQMVNAARIAFATGGDLCFAHVDIRKHKCRTRGGGHIIWSQFKRTLIRIQCTGQIVAATNDIPQPGPQLGACG